MSDLSKPILLSGAAGFVLYTVICLTSSVVFFTFYIMTRYTANSNPAVVGTETLAEVAVSEIPIHLLTPAPLHTSIQFLTPGKIMTFTTPNLTESPKQELETDAPLPSPTNTRVIPTETLPPTPNFAAIAAQATALAQKPETLSPTKQAVSVPPEWTSITQKLVAEGLITSTQGSFYFIPDYEDSWNQTDWQRWSYVEQTPANFILRAKASWDTTAVAGMTANSGCGFVFRENGAENYYLMYLGLNGRVYFYRMKDGIIKYLGNSIYYPVQSPSGEAEIMLLANGMRFTFFVDGDNVYDVLDGYFLSGKIGLTVVSGSAQDFGTRCKMENIELWAIE